MNDSKTSSTRLPLTLVSHWQEHHPSISESVCSLHENQVRVTRKKTTWICSNRTLQKATTHLLGSGRREQCGCNLRFPFVFKRRCCCWVIPQRIGLEVDFNVETEVPPGYSCSTATATRVKWLLFRLALSPTPHWYCCDLLSVTPLIHPVTPEHAETFPTARRLTLSHCWQKHCGLFDIPLTKYLYGPWFDSWLGGALCVGWSMLALWWKDSSSRMSPQKCFGII